MSDGSSGVSHGLKEFLLKWEGVPLFALFFIGVSLCLHLVIDRPAEAYVFSSLAAIGVYIALVLYRWDQIHE